MLFEIITPSIMILYINQIPHIAHFCMCRTFLNIPKMSLFYPVKIFSSGLGFKLQELHRIMNLDIGKYEDSQIEYNDLSVKLLPWSFNNH